MIKRRKLISLTALGTAIATITGIFGRDASRAQNKATLVKIGSLSNLKAKGELAGKTAKGPVIVVSSGKTGAISAVNPTCTHEGCRVKWQKSQEKFICPCHGAQFSATGQKLKGPAGKNLPTYATQMEGDTVLVKV
jgi:cytochrome b6-f complex iron-sulfur subunit